MNKIQINYICRIVSLFKKFNIVIGITLTLCLISVMVKAEQPPPLDLEIDGVFTDIKTGKDYNLVFNAMEFKNDETGTGAVFLKLAGPVSPDKGPKITVCDVHGFPADPDINPDLFPEDFEPLQWGFFGFGGSARISVAIKNCTAIIETHGFVHSDHPFVNYFGFATIGLKIKKHKKNQLMVEIKAYTPKETIVLKGRLQEGAVKCMATCDLVGPCEGQPPCEPMSIGKTCEEYCEDMGKECVGAARDDDDGCPGIETECDEYMYDGYCYCE